MVLYSGYETIWIFVKKRKTNKQTNTNGLLISRDYSLFFATTNVKQTIKETEINYAKEMRVIVDKKQQPRNMR